MKKVTVIIALVYVSTFGFTACDSDSDFEEFQIEKDIEDVERNVDEDAADGNGAN